MCSPQTDYRFALMPTALHLNQSDDEFEVRKDVEIGQSKARHPLIKSVVSSSHRDLSACCLQVMEKLIKKKKSKYHWTIRNKQNYYTCKIRQRIAHIYLYIYIFLNPAGFCSVPVFPVSFSKTFAFEMFSPIVLQEEFISVKTAVGCQYFINRDV